MHFLIDSQTQLLNVNNMSLNWTTTDKQGAEGIKCAVYGRDGSGKTSLIPTAPRPVILDTEGKTLSIKEHGIPTLRIITWQDWLDAYEWIKGSSEMSKFDTVYFDSISELAVIGLAHFKAKYADGRKAYGEFRDAMSTAIRNALALPQKNVVLNAKASLIELPDSTKIYAPSLPGMTAEQALGYSVQELFYLGIGSYDGTPENGITPKIEYRYLQTKQDIYVQARDNSRTLLAQEAAETKYGGGLTALFAKIRNGAIVA